MAKRDSFDRTYPIKITYREKELASRSKITAFQKLTEQAFSEIERAIGDIYNTENATGSPLSSNPLYINSLGRSIGNMANLVPILSGVSEYSPILASRMEGFTYNVIPHPNQTKKIELGCKYDMTLTPDATTRGCVKNQTAFYRQSQGAETGICQSTNCPYWSARDGRKFESEICQDDASSVTYREYKAVVPTEQRTVIRPTVAYYSNCGIIYDKYRVDGGVSAYGDNESDPSQSWALATNESLAVSGVSEQIQYIYPDLNTDSTYNMVIEIPALETDQNISVNNITLANIQGNSIQPTRWFLNLEGFTDIQEIRLVVGPANTNVGTQAALSQVWLIENRSRRHQNYGTLLKLPKPLENLSHGTEIPPNFLQIFDSHYNVNRILDKVKMFVTRFNPSVTRDAVDILIYGDQKLELNNTRYLLVTTGTPVAPTVGALLEAFVEHVSDTRIHMNREAICELLSDTTHCCDGRLKADLVSLSPASKVAPTVSDANYQISASIYGGFPPYTVTIDWGDGLTVGDAISGIETFELTRDVAPPESVIFSHQYQSAGSFDVEFDVSDDPEIFGCTASLTSQVSPFNVGNPPVIDSEVRLDYATSYPNFVFQDITDGYNFSTTNSSDWTSNPTYHILTQVHNTDVEDGRAREFYWEFDNPDGLVFQFYYEDISGVQETINFAGGSASLTHDFIQQDSVVLKKGSTVFVEDTDYVVNHASGTITTTGSSIGNNEDSVEAYYFHYPNATTIASVSGQWVQLGNEQSNRTIQLSNLTSRTDLNTIRFKIKEG